MPLAAPAIVTACGKTEIICGKFSSTGQDCVCNPAIVAWDLLKRNGATIDDDSFFYVADHCEGLTGSDSYRNWHNSEYEEILRMCRLGGFTIYVDSDGIFKVEKFSDIWNRIHN